jgi:hypothetical protein
VRGLSRTVPSTWLRERGSDGVNIDANRSATGRVAVASMVHTVATGRFSQGASSLRATWSLPPQPGAFRRHLDQRVGDGSTRRIELLIRVDAGIN